MVQNVQPSSIAGTLGSALENTTNNLNLDPTNSINSPLGSVNSFLSGALDNASTVATALSNPAASIASGIDKMPGGQGSIASLVDGKLGSVTASIPGIDKIKGLIDEAQTAAMNGLPEPGELLNTASSGLSALASTGLPVGAASQLQAAISSISNGSGAIKLPTVATETNNRTALSRSVTNILGDPGIPDPKFSGKPPASSEILSVVAAQAAYDRAEEEVNKAKTAYYRYKNEVYDPHIEERDNLLKTTEKGDPKREAWNAAHPGIRAELARLADEANVKIAERTEAYLALRRAKGLS